MKISKKITYLFIAAFMIFSCGNTKQSSEASEEKQNPPKNTVQNQEKEERQTDSIDFNRLLIQGENIWLRDKQADGEVILKLNTGDTCKLLDIGEFEIIKGNADFWYQVEYKKQKAWVFGSQTDIKLGLSEPQTVDDVWKIFKKAQEIWCYRFTKFFTDSTDHDRGIICQPAEQSPTAFTLKLPCDECVKRVSYAKGKSDSDRLIIACREFMGGAMGCYDDFSKQAFKVGGKWNMRLANDLPGKVDTSFSVSSGKEFTTVIYKRDCGIIGNYALSICEINRENNTVSVKVRELYSQDWNKQSGMPYIDSISTDYELSEDTQNFVLTKHRKHPDESDLDKLTIRFRWDAVKEAFVRE